MQRFVLFLAAVCVSCVLLASPASARRRGGQSSWEAMQSELQSELDAGMDESQLSRMEESVVSAESTRCALQQPRRCDTHAPAVVELQVTIDAGTVGSVPQRGSLVLELFNATVPRTVDNFLTICSSARRGLSFNGNKFHRIISGFMAQVPSAERQCSPPSDPSA
jgi:hypothetical protein